MAMAPAEQIHQGNEKLHTVDVRCWSPACGTKQKGAILFRISKDKTTIFKICERCHSWQAIVIADIPVVD